MAKKAQHDDDSVLKWIAIGGLSAILIGGAAFGLVATKFGSSPQQAQTTEARQNKKDDKKKSAETKKDDKQKVADAKKDDKAKPLTEEQLKENDAKCEELLKKADEAVNQSMQATSKDKREAFRTAAKTFCEIALKYARTDDQKYRANFGIAACYTDITKFERGKLSESDAAQWLSCAQQAVDTATTESQKGQAYNALSDAQEYNGLYREAISNLLTASEHCLNGEGEYRKGGVTHVCDAGLKTLKYLHDTDMAKQIFQKALTLATEETGKDSDRYKAFALAGLTLATLMEGNRQKADQILRTAIQHDKATAYTIVGNWSKELGIELSSQTNSSTGSSNFRLEDPNQANNPFKQQYENKVREERDKARNQILEATGFDISKVVPNW